jgi:hypothetical protein
MNPWLLKVKAKAAAGMSCYILRITSLRVRRGARKRFLLTFAFSGGLALLDLYAHGKVYENISWRLPFVSVLVVLMGYGREKIQRNLRSTYLHPR